MLLLKQPQVAHRLTASALAIDIDRPIANPAVTPMAPLTAPPARHFASLDGLRGWAILIVLIHHFTPAASGGTAFTRGALRLAHTGWIGVDLFFVLSGFLITGILLRTRSKPDFFKNFYARRTLRIFPLYYGCLAALLIVVPALLRYELTGDFLYRHFRPLVDALPTLSAGQSWLWLYGTNIKIAADENRWQFVNHFWSLAVEEHFYMAWPLAVWCLGTRRLVVACVACIAGAPLLRGLTVAGGWDPVAAYVLTPCRVDGLALGGLLAILLTRPGGAERWLPRLRLVALASAGLLGIIAAVFGRLDRADGITTIIGYTLVSLVAAWLVVAATTVTRRRSFAGLLLLNPVAQSFGKLSYGLYVLHVFFIPVFLSFFGWSNLTRLTGSYLLALVLHAAIAIACSWAIAWVSFHVFEKHFLKLKVFFESGSQKPKLRAAPTRAIDDASRRLPVPAPACAFAPAA